MRDFDMIWHDVVWTISSVCNDIIFSSSSSNVKEVEEKVFF